MYALSKPALTLLKHPAAFALHTLRSFQKNQGLLLAGAIAYYALLSIVPLLILVVIALSHLVDQSELLNTLSRYMEWLVPSQSEAFISDLSGFLENRIAIGSLLLVTMLFFSSLGFSVLEKAMAVIFHRRITVSRRHFLVSAVLPYCFVLFLGIALLGVTFASIGLQAVAQESITVLGRSWSLRGVSGVLLYLLGLGFEILTLTAIYWIIPIGRIPLRHAVLGAVAATSLWEIIRHVLIWYFVAFSKASVVYGSLTTAVVALFSMEIAATLLLLGAQVIAEYERIGER
jgi:membrane protein